MHFKDNRLTLKKSSGTALKWSGEPVMPNVVAYTLMATLTYATLFEAGWFEQHPTGNGPPPLSLTPSQHVEGGTPFGVDALATDLGTPQGLPKVTAESTNPWELAPPQGQTSPDPFPVYAAERQDLPQPPR